MTRSLRRDIDWISPATIQEDDARLRYQRVRATRLWVGSVHHPLPTTSASSATAAGTREQRAKPQMVWLIPTEEAEQNRCRSWGRTGRHGPH